MLVLRLLNVVAPAYFLCISLVTFVLQIFLFIPSMFRDPSTTPLFSPALLHGALFLFLSANALGNYILVIQSSPEELGKGLNLGEGAEMVADWLDGSRSPGSALPSTHYCRLCARVTQRHDPHCFFTGNCIGSRNMRNFIMFCLYTSLACLDSLVAGMAYISASLSMSFANPLAFLTLLPHSISQFFSGKDPSLAMRSPFFLQGSGTVAMLFAVWLCVRMGGGGCGHGENCLCLVKPPLKAKASEAGTFSRLQL